MATEGMIVSTTNTSFDEVLLAPKKFIKVKSNLYLILFMSSSAGISVGGDSWKADEAKNARRSVMFSSGSELFTVIA